MVHQMANQKMFTLNVQRDLSNALQMCILNKEGCHLLYPSFKYAYDPTMRKKYAKGLYQPTQS